MNIIINIITLLSVIYAVGCTSFLTANSPQKYYKTAYVSAAVMIFILILRFIYIKIGSSNNDSKKSNVIDIVMYPMYYLTGLFELNIKYGYGNTIGISGTEEKIGLLYTMGLPYKLCNLLSVLIFIITWIILILKVKYASDCEQILKSKTALPLIALGAFITIKCLIGILFNISNYNVYLDIATAHIIYWCVYFISIWCVYFISMLKEDI